MPWLSAKMRYYLLAMTKWNSLSLAHLSQLFLLHILMSYFRYTSKNRCLLDSFPPLCNIMREASPLNTLSSLTFTLRKQYSILVWMSWWCWQTMSKLVCWASYWHQYFYRTGLEIVVLLCKGEQEQHSHGIVIPKQTQLYSDWYESVGIVLSLFWSRFGIADNALLIPFCPLDVVGQFLPVCID